MFWQQTNKPSGQQIIWPTDYWVIWAGYVGNMTWMFWQDTIWVCKDD